MLNKTLQILRVKTVDILRMSFIAYLRRFQHVSVILRKRKCDDAIKNFEGAHHQPHLGFPGFSVLVHCTVIYSWVEGLFMGQMEIGLK
jgi:hypothetical protein